MALTIASLHVRGLRDNTKRKKHFSMYIMLQEVHCTENTTHVYNIAERAIKFSVRKRAQNLDSTR